MTFNRNNYLMPGKRNIVYHLALFLSISLKNSLRLKLILIIAVMVSSAFHLIHIQYFGKMIRPAALMQFFQNTGEVFDSLIPESSSTVAPLVLSALIAAALIFVMKKFQEKSFTFSCSASVFFGALIVHALIISYQLNTGSEMLGLNTARFIHPRPNMDPFENCMRSMNCFLTGIGPQPNSRTADDFPDLSASTAANPNPHRNVILVIGESLQADRMSLFDYANKTTALPDSIAQTEPFTRKIVLAGGTMTRTVFAVLLSSLRSPWTGRQLAGFTNNLFKLTKDKVFATHIISKQSYSQCMIVDNPLCRNIIDEYCPSGDVAEAPGDKTHFDGDLLIMPERIDLNNSNIIVLHQRGSHSSSVRLYPDRSQEFEGCYDNTVLYTNFVLAEICDYLKNNSTKKTHLIFTSDHDEMLGHVKEKKGHGCFEKEVHYVPYLNFALNSTDYVMNGQDKDSFI